MPSASIFSDEISPDFEEAVVTAAACGLHHIDLRNAWGKQWQQFDPQDWQRMRRVMQAHDMQMGCLQSQFGKCGHNGYSIPAVDSCLSTAPHSIVMSSSLASALGSVPA